MVAQKTSLLDSSNHAFGTTSMEAILYTYAADQAEGDEAKALRMTLYACPSWLRRSVERSSYETGWSRNKCFGALISHGAADLNERSVVAQWSFVKTLMAGLVPGEDISDSAITLIWHAAEDFDMTLDDRQTGRRRVELEQFPESPRQSLTDFRLTVGLKQSAAAQVAATWALVRLGGAMHEQEYAKEFCDRFIVLSDHRLRACAALLSTFADVNGDQKMTLEKIRKGHPVDV